MPSEDGWEPAQATPDQCEWVTVPGTNPPVNLQLLKGWPLAILRAFAADFNAYVEHLRNDDSAAWTPTNSVPTSNHLNATAMDLNWDSHRFQISYDGFSPDQIATCRELLDYYEGTVQWGQDWGGNPYDCMHWNLGYNTYNNPHTGDVVARKIRADGFSTFRRDNVPVPPPPPPVLSRADGYALKIIAEGQRRGITPRGIEIALATALVESNIQIYSNEAVPESMNIPHDAVGSDAYSVGIFQQQVRDTGSGWWWGDAATCMDPTSSAGLFYDRLAKLDYNNVANSPGSYAQTVQQSAFPDRYDQRWGDATDIYNRLATGAPPAPPTPGDDMALVPQEQWDRVYRELTDLRTSRSPLREPDEGQTDTWSGFGLNTDGSEHVNVCKILANYGHPPVIALLQRVAAMPVDKPGREGNCLIAQAILAEAEQSRLAREAKAAPVGTAANNVAPVAPVAPQVVYVDRPVAAPAPVVDALPAVVEQPASTGQLIGRVYDDLEKLRLADALPIEGRAPLAALIAVLNTKNGSQL